MEGVGSDSAWIRNFLVTQLFFPGPVGYSWGIYWISSSYSYICKIYIIYPDSLTVIITIIVFFRSIKWSCDCHKLCHKCSATPNPCHTPYPDDESVPPCHVTGRPTWGSDHHCDVTSHTPCDKWWNGRFKKTLVAYWRGKFNLNES